MRNAERFRAVLNFVKPADRLPLVEWAGWWDQTLDRWCREGLDRPDDPEALRERLGLDMLRQFWLWPHRAGFPGTEVADEADYDRLRPYLYPERLAETMELSRLEALRALHDRGEVVVWVTLNGFFWHPRTLFGIERHLYAFYDQPALMHRINADLAAFNRRILEEFCAVLQPEFITLAEDMSYNHGPMLSEACFREFLLPYYRQVLPAAKRRGIKVFVDTDGDPGAMLPWLLEAGVDGVLPLERQAGVDVGRLRERFPSLLMLGGFDKMVMHRGEQAMRREFERLLPVMRAGGYIPSCDHQTPPAVSLEDYRLYLRLLREYCQRAVE